MASVEERRRTVRRLVGRTGRGLAEEFGFQVTNSPSNLFQILCLSILLGSMRDYRRAVRAAQALRDRWDSAGPLARSPDGERLRVLREAGAAAQAPKLAGTLRDLAGVVVDRYGGDLRRLRGQAGQDPVRERQLMKQLPGVDDGVVDLFFREVQAPWREIAPFVDRRALTAARKLGLGRTAADLSEISGGRGSEKIAWLAGALARVEMDKSYDTVRDSARA